MIEEGIVLLVQANAAVLAIAPIGGFLLDVPKDLALPTWTFQTITKPGDYTLFGPIDLTTREVQIDCYGDTGEQIIDLAKAIDAVLNGYKGTLTDPDHTLIHGIFRDGETDFRDEAGRTKRRMLEYSITYSNI